MKDEEKAEEKSFNINNKVRFIVTKEWSNRICEYWSERHHEDITLDKLFGIEDIYGYRSCQLWVLMEYIGPLIRMGELPPIHTEILIKENNLHDMVSPDKRPPTVKQLDFICVICKVLEIEKPKCDSRNEARFWISEHIEEYHHQLDYLRDFENYDWNMPNGD